MNKLKLIFALLLFVLCSSKVKAQVEEQSSQNESVLLEKKNDNNRGKRRNIPSKQHVTCHLFEDNIALWLTIPEGWCNLIVEDENMNISVFTFDSSALEFETTLSNMKGCLHLTLTTQTGRTYSGILNNH